MFKAPAFHCDGDIIRITNSHGRGHSITLVVFALFSLTLPLWRSYAPFEYVAFTDAEGGADLCLLVVALCLSAAFWWSEVTIDPKADEVVIVRRWGLSRSMFRRPLSSFECVSLGLNSDGQPEIVLLSKPPETAIDWNYAHMLVWGRLPEEARQIALVLAERLRLRLEISREAERACDFGCGRLL